jgi:2,3-bisphosphoglycerate-independent phosphoglycerate mutase
VPDGFSPGSDIANLSVLGYDPAGCYTGRGALEAASMGIDLKDGEYAYRCNLVTIQNGIMEDFNAGHITSAEGAALLKSLNERLTGAAAYPGISYRNLVVIPAAGGSVTTAPHDITGQEIAPHLPSGPDAPLLDTMMNLSREVFAGHPVNRERIAAGNLPATQVWPWSGGARPAIPSFQDRWNKTGGMISAVDLLNGIAKYAGMEIISVPGATGFIDTDYQAKARYAVEALKRLDFVYLHVEAPDEAGHMGSITEKIRAIEEVDRMLGTILSGFDGRILLLPDHPTPIRIKTHTADPVPFVLYGKDRDDTRVYSEKEAASGMYGCIRGTDLLPLLFS